MSQSRPAGSAAKKPPPPKVVSVKGSSVPAGRLAPALPKGKAT